MNSRRLFCLIMVPILLAGSLGLTACQDDDDYDRLPLPTVVITFEPQPEVTVVPGCTTKELEDWYEVAQTLLATFIEEASDATDLKPEELGPVIERLLMLRDTIAYQPTPECTVQIQSDILIVIRGALIAFQSFGSGEIDRKELRQRIEDAERQVNTEINDLMTTTQVDLEERLSREGGS